MLFRAPAKAAALKRENRAMSTNVTRPPVHELDIRRLTPEQLMQLGMAMAADCDLAVAAIVQHEMRPALGH